MAGARGNRRSGHRRQAFEGDMPTPSGRLAVPGHLASNAERSGGGRVPRLALTNAGRLYPACADDGPPRRRPRCGDGGHSWPHPDDAIHYRRGWIR